MALKTDYKDAVYTGNRKYTQTNNTDGTVSLVDATAYSTEGDPFGAADINATNQVVNANSDSISALQRACLVGTQENGVVHLWVYGTKPTIDIPITVIFRGEK